MTAMTTAPAPATTADVEALLGRLRAQGFTITPPLPARERAARGTHIGAHRWTPEQVAEVDAAIRAVASFRRTFTTDDVWLELGPDFPVGKGITGRLNAASNAGRIVSTGATVISVRKGAHGKSQRLTVWATLDQETLTP